MGKFPFSQVQSKCLHTSIVGNIMTTNDEYKFINDQNINNDKVLMRDFEDENKFNDEYYTE